MVRYLAPLCLVGCIGYPEPKMSATPGEPPPNPAHVASCENTRTWHNVWTLTSTILGATASAGGTTAVAVGSNGDHHDVVVGIDVGIAITGGLGAISAVAAGIEAETYSVHDCQNILSKAGGWD